MGSLFNSTTISTTIPELPHGQDGKEKFVQVPNTEIGGLLQVLKGRLPKSGPVYNCALRLSRHPGEFGMYTLHGDLITSNALVVVVLHVFEFDQTIGISVPLSWPSCLSSSNPTRFTDEVVHVEYVKQAFIDTQIIDWKGTFKFAALDRSISPIIAEISAFVKETPTYCNTDFDYYCVPIDEALHMEIPTIKQDPNTEIVTRKLDTVHGAQFVNSHWKYAHDNSLAYSKEVIKRHPSCGIYINDKPVSGVISHSDLLIGMLATDPKHQNKGYALICMKTLIRDLAREGYIPSSCVKQGNVVSKKFHSKCGMTMSYKCDFIFHL